MLQRQILQALDQEAYEYDGYSTGWYDHHKAAGVTLQLPSVLSGLDTHAIFNATLTRDRTTKAGAKGSPLPKGHFRIGKRSHLYRFWLSTQLPIPKRLSSLHDYMGNLRGILFTATKIDGHEKRLDKESLRPLTISADEIRKAVQPDNGRAATRQIPYSYQTRLPDKDLAPAQQNRGIHEKPTTGVEHHGKAVISRYEHTGARPSVPPRKRLEEQTTEEWLEECFPSTRDDAAEPLHRRWKWS
ncbi:hypothetical protein LDP37_00050 [Pseudomonas aeruginosa]|uniref:hypothetical protein n=1 Tax=Pseudomonas aeruginosa TaxID=287 RepID=UPI001EED22D0|nr:hypothetical protein [Pseudomonas aeruginosa]MCG7015166.1 hypothetical protein [Pseudomonas aeruginosa]MCG7027846.1 hypothetical protein [Pseudomonas aeruginosa]MCG7057077.1 hypothetical protein [Pseudomonas aeruginosa]MCG7062902.1 hypothetical protein [Pseudomonas aeruginosa]HDP4830717.1 hypothetical protein [Pseudomonas aeruginosa]